MDSDFRFMISKTKSRNSFLYEICVNYIGNHRGYIEAINSIIESHYTGLKSNYCLFRLSLTVNYNQLVKGSYSLGYGEYLDWEMPSKVNLDAFFNKAQTKGIMNWPQSQKLKGIGHASLCIVLNDIIKSGIATVDDNITLEASGNIPNIDMEGLIKYYERLGFKQLLPEHIELALSQGIVPMYAAIGDIIKVCSQATFSDDIKNIIQGI